MSKRVRLTERSRHAVEDNVPYPGTVNQPDRKFKRNDQYDNYEETINHPTPDMRHEWKDDERDDIGFGIPDEGQPTVAAVRVAAGKAVKMAVLLLGEKVAEEVVEDQARDFMSMSSDAMDRTLSRFAETQELYVAEDDSDDDDDDVVEAAEEEKKDEESKEAAEDEKKEEESKEAAEEVKAEDEKEEESKEAAEEVKAEDEKKDEESKEAAEDEKKEEESKEAAEEVKAEDEKDEESKEAAEDEKEEESKEAAEEVVETKKSSTEMDIELTSAVDEIATDPEVDAQLASLFDGDMVAEDEDDSETTEASEKAGIKKLGGQPKVASKSGMADISSIWDSAPDVSTVFE